MEIQKTAVKKGNARKPSDRYLDVMTIVFYGKLNQGLTA
jgi:hypothetical protein